MFRKSSFFWPLLGAVLLTVLVGAWRVTALSMTEPRVDQAFFAAWVGALDRADHLLPPREAGEGLRSALERDADGGAHIIVRTIYNSPVAAFTVVPLGALWSAAKVAGSSDYRLQTTISIAAGTLVIPILALFGLWGATRPGPREHLQGMLAAILAACSLQLYLFAPFGIHNFGIATLILALAVLQWALPRLGDGHAPPSKRLILAVLATQALALYSHWTNIFLLPAITALALLTIRRSWHRRLSVVAATGIAVAAIMAPAALLLAKVSAEAEAAQTHFTLLSLAALVSNGSDAGLLAAMGGRALDWWHSGSELFSLWGLIGGIAGTVLMAARGLPVAVLAVAIHAVAFILIPPMAWADLRTYAYVLPPLCLGLAECVGAAWRCRPALAAAVVVVGAHLWSQLPALVDPARMAAAAPRPWDFYYRGQGDGRRLVADIDRLVPDGALLLTWSYNLNFLYQVLSERPGGPLPLPSALDGLWLRHHQGTLADWRARRRVDLGHPQRIYLLGEEAPGLPPLPELTLAMNVLLGDELFGLRRHARLVPITHWPLTLSFPGATTLWEIVEADPASR